MRISYINVNGLQSFHDLAGEPMVIGRSPDADLTIDDEKVSRFHCGIRFDEGRYRLKDLGSRNGTFLNGEPVQAPCPLESGDHIRVGSTLLLVEERLSKGMNTILHEIEEEMDHGKGYHTILHEIVEPEHKNKEN
jgi:pSer/pThr/pTyr-binding forkhead associated (FHA) protein